MCICEYRISLYLDDASPQIITNVSNECKHPGVNIKLDHSQQINALNIEERGIFYSRMVICSLTISNHITNPSLLVMTHFLIIKKPKLIGHDPWLSLPPPKLFIEMTTEGRVVYTDPTLGLTEEAVARVLEPRCDQRLLKDGEGWFIAGEGWFIGG